MPDAIEAAARTLSQGGVIVYPTDTLWGIGASIRHPDAIRRVFQLKRRPPSEPLSIALARAGDVSRYAHVPPHAKRLLDLLPGALTILLERNANVPDVVTGGSPLVGVRVPDHAACLSLVARSGPVTTTSANLHGEPDPQSLGDARGAFGDRVDYYLDAGSPPLGRASTIVDATVDPVRIVRQGVVRESRIRELTAH